MSDENITRLAVIRLCEIVKQLTCCSFGPGDPRFIPSGAETNNRLSMLYDDADLIAKELERP